MDGLYDPGDRNEILGKPEFHLSRFGGEHLRLQVNMNEQLRQKLSIDAPFRLPYHCLVLIVGPYSGGPAADLLYSSERFHLCGDKL